MKRDMEKGFGSERVPKGRRSVLAGGFLLLTAFGVLGLASSVLQQQDPVELVRRKGTAGMKLSGGQAIVVREGKLYVRSGRSVRPLLPERTQLLVMRNTSGINSNGLVKLAEEAAKSKLRNLYDQSYKVHGAFELKARRGDVSTVVCHLTFEYRNIWYAEERTLEIDVVPSGPDYILRGVRALVAPPVRLKAQAGPAPSIKPVPARQSGQTRLATAAKAGAAVRADVTRKIVAKYPTFEALPIHSILDEFPVARIPPGPRAKALANTAYPEVVTAAEATDQVQALFLLALGSATKLVGPAESSRDNLLNYLRNDDDLVAWNNIGHGNTTKLFQNGTDILHTDISGGAAPFKGLANCVILNNACQTFNDPLKAAVIGRGPRTYIAGVINLPMATSEGSNPFFWFRVLFLGKPMSVAYNETNNQAGLNGYWGFWGDAGIF